VSAENVELVRRTVAALAGALDSYWRDPRPLARAYEAGELGPEWEEWLAHLHPETEWQTVFLGETFHGHEESVRVWNDFLRWADDYRVTLDRVDDLGDDRVYAEVSIAGRTKDDGPRMASRFYQVMTIRDGTIWRLEEYTTREEALEAAGRPAADSL
jgi:ketosteroid isomerase-like protein